MMVAQTFDSWSNKLLVFPFVHIIPYRDGHLMGLYQAFKQVGADQLEAWSRICTDMSDERAGDATTQHGDQIASADKTLEI